MAVGEVGINIKQDTIMIELIEEAENLYKKKRKIQSIYDYE